MDGINATRTASVPSFGDVTVTCDTQGIASFSWTLPDAWQAREDITTTNGQSQTQLVRSVGGQPETFSSSAAPFGKTVAVTVDKPGKGIWRLDGTILSKNSIITFSCFATAVVTIVQ